MKTSLEILSIVDCLDWTCSSKSEHCSCNIIVKLLSKRLHYIYLIEKSKLSIWFVCEDVKKRPEGLRKWLIF